MTIHFPSLRNMATWFGIGKRTRLNDIPTATPIAKTTEPRIEWPDDEEEMQRHREVGIDLVKYQSVARGY